MFKGNSWPDGKCSHGPICLHLETVNHAWRLVHKHSVHYTASGFCQETTVFRTLLFQRQTTYQLESFQIWCSNIVHRDYRVYQRSYQLRMALAILDRPIAMLDSGFALIATVTPLHKSPRQYNTKPIKGQKSYKYLLDVVAMVLYIRLLSYTSQ